MWPISSMWISVFWMFFFRFGCPGLVVYVNEAVSRKRGSLLRKGTTHSSYTGLPLFVTFKGHPKKNFEVLLSLKMKMFVVVCSRSIAAFICM